MTDAVSTGHSRLNPAAPNPNSAPSYGAAATAALTAIIERGAEILVREPWRAARLVRDADRLTLRELSARVRSMRRAAGSVDLNRAIGLAQLDRAMQTRQFALAWSHWRAERAEATGGGSARFDARSADNSSAAPLSLAHCALYEAD